ncbi:MAG: aspartate/glutamate racemase family protein [Candidatus Bipolaricaulota bacterium]
MRIKAIMASSSEELAQSQLPSRQAALAEGTDVAVVAPRGCPPATESEQDRLVAALAVFSEVVAAKEEGFDAVTIDCTLDPGLKAAKKASRIPVVGAGEAALCVSLLFGERFSVIMPGPTSVSPMVSKIREMGLTDRLASVRSVRLHVLDLDDDERTLDAVRKAARQAIEEDGADVIVLGCTAMGRIAGALAEQIGVPVIEPATTALKLAEAFAAPNWRPALAPTLRAGG